MAIEKIVIPFCGYPIYKISTGETLDADELRFLKNLDKTSNHKEGKTKLTEGVNILNNIELKRIKYLILENFFDYVDNVLEIENNFYMCNSWGTTQKKGDFHPQHNHPNAVFSSVFYVQASDSSITFSLDKSKIMEGFLIEYKIKKYNLFNSLSWEVPVSSGDMIIFPGELHHQSQIHNDDTDRLIIGASYFLSGDLGFDNNYNSISI